MQTIEHFRDLLTINKHALDDELVQHSDVMYRIAESLTKHGEFYASAVDELKKAEAEAFAAQKMILIEGKPQSDTRADMAARNDPHRNKAWSAMTGAKAEQERWQKLYDAWVAKGHNMKQMVSLYCTGNFSVGLPLTRTPRTDYTQPATVPTRRRAGA